MDEARRLEPSVMVTENHYETFELLYGEES